ncbi:hypothetical protein G6045_08925 [Streptomyces sp. YC504]|uniref:Uncharacterized protein n=1 Tax=Streptomyces mesophilus TaxID=1775132 RepID=A0A6G4XEY4_9ACTN|nr:hypothetical protein [Streptomyces mesophilus]NGO75793.1 hypothetical protein [Streptomyces mesophilus]
MFVFVCVGCGGELTAPLTQVALPVHARQSFGNGLKLPVLMESGTFAVDPEPSGPPWRPWEDIDPGEAADRGIYAPVDGLFDGAPGAIVIAPGDTRGTVLIPGKRGGTCCGMDGADGPNMACEACGLPVASRIDDCSLWQAVWLAPNAVRRRPVDGGEVAPLSWAELVAEGRSTPPFEPIVNTWGRSWLGLHDSWSWSPQWEAAAGRALAHLLVASQGRPVTVQEGLVEEVFQRALDALLPKGPPKQRAVLAGPGQPAPDTDTDILLVPPHPQTGKTWMPPGPAASAYPVPLPFGVWLWLVSPEPDLPVPASGGLPDGVLRDDLTTPLPHRLFQADSAVFRHTLTRLPAVRSPWLREILENLTQHMRAGLFGW